MGKPGNTPAQVAQRERAWRIFRLRSLAKMVGILSPRRADICRALIDADLIDLGADRTKVHDAKANDRPPRTMRRDNLKPF